MSALIVDENVRQFPLEEKIKNNFQNCTHFVVKKKSTQFCFGF